METFEGSKKEIRIKRTKLTKENWENKFDDRLVDWNNPRFIQSNHPVHEVKEFIKQLLEDINEKVKIEEKGNKSYSIE